MNTSTTTNKPVQKLRDGALSATIWKNPGKNGTPRYSVNLSRVYEDEHGNLKDSDSFSGNELLRIARLAQIAYDEVLIYRQQNKQAASEPQSEANGS